MAFYAVPSLGNCACSMVMAVRTLDHLGMTCMIELDRVVEFGKTGDIFTRPEHEETENYITGRFG